MESEKVVGYALLTVGVAMIFVSVYLMYNVFTGASSPPVLVHFSDISMPVPSPGEAESISIVSGEDLSKIVALGFWYTLMFFIMWAGGKLASLGVSLIKETKVEVKEAAPATRVGEVYPQGEQEVEEHMDTIDEEARARATRVEEEVYPQGEEDIEEHLDTIDEEAEETHREAEE